MDRLYQVPFAALSDGKPYLIEKYALAITPGLMLTKTASLSPEEKGLLLSGLSEKVANYSRRCHVQKELNAVQSFYPHATRLDNDQFTKTQIQHELQQHHHSMVLFATHAKFSSVARESFILTHDGPMTLNELGQLIRNLPEPVELLTLSACETAKGDSWQAALGLAGVAVKAGTQSALGSLWKVNDEATSALMPEFYKQLQQSPPPSKAKALQQAQRVLLTRPEYRTKPRLWAGFVLIGQWQ